MSFVPSDLPSIIAHWRGEDIPSGTPDPLNWDDVVSAWRLSASGTARSTYSATAIGGLPGLVFDDTNDVLITTTSKAMLGTPMIAIVCNLTSYSTNNSLFGMSTTAALPAFGANQRLTYFQDSATMYFYPTNNANSAWLKPSMATGTDIIAVFGVGPNKAQHAISGNRSTMYTGTGTGGVIVPQTDSIYLTVGGMQSAILWNGPISEVVLWNDPYETSYQSHVEGFLAHKYSITLPTWHPFFAEAPTSGPSSGGNTLAAIRHGIHLGNRGVK